MNKSFPPKRGVTFPPPQALEIVDGKRVMVPRGGPPFFSVFNNLRGSGKDSTLSAYRPVSSRSFPPFVLSPVLVEVW